jgi:hypothetical protein
MTTPTVIDSYNGTGTTLGGYINAILTTNQEIDDVPNAPHQAFWDTLSYTQFTTGTVPGVSGSGSPYPILEIGKGANSNFVLALQGGGPLFGSTGSIGQMPADGNPPSMPFFTAAQIQPIIDWINAGCPNPGGS